MMHVNHNVATQG